MLALKLRLMRPSPGIAGSPFRGLHVRKIGEEYLDIVGLKNLLV
jgi:hypothetical protein